jgi:Mrp family chromosome partitioning ATPase
MGAYDRIIVDSPPVLGAADSLVWASVSDGVLLATLADGSTRKAVKLACQRLRSIGANLLGAVVANVSLDNAYYSYSTTSVTDSDLLESAQAGHSHRHAVLPLLADGGDDVSSSDKRG